MKSFKYIFLISLLGFLPTLFPLLQGWITLFSRTWILSSLIFLSIFLFKINSVSQKFVLPLYLFAIVIFLNYLADDPIYSNITQNIMNFAMFFCSSVVFSIYSKNASIKQLKIVIILFCTILIITLIGTFSVYIVDPNIMRTIQSDINSGGLNNLRTLYNKLGVESYEMGHALPVFLPIIIYNIRTSKLSIFLKIFWIVILVIVCMLIYMSTATTSLILASILLFASSIFPLNGIKTSKLLVYIIFIIFFSFTIIPLLNILLEFFANNSEGIYASKSVELLNLLNTGEIGTSAEARKFLYKKTLDAFFTNPLLGANTNEIGGHTILLDALASLGIIGTFPLFLFLYRYYKYINFCIHKQLRPFFLLSYIEIILMSSIKAVSGFEYWTLLLFIMPLFYLHASKRITLNK